MKITLLSVGKTSNSEIEALVRGYERRLKHYVNFELNILEIPAKMKRKTEEEQKQAEGELILNTIRHTSPLFLLDEKGKSLSSMAFSSFLQTEMNRGPKELVFCIGGAFGFSDAVYQKATKQISLSQMTFTHQMIRLFFTEQLYRAFTILRGEKYHH